MAAVSGRQLTVSLILPVVVYEDTVSGGPETGPMAWKKAPD